MVAELCPPPSHLFLIFLIPFVFIPFYRFGLLTFNEGDPFVLFPPPPVDRPSKVDPCPPPLSP